MFWLFDSAIRRGAEKGVDDFIASDRFKEIMREKVLAVVQDELAKVPHWKFLKQIQSKLQHCDQKMTDEEGFHMAKHILQQHLRGERIEFGDPRFGWTRQDAYDLAQAYEIDHWEASA